MLRVIDESTKEHCALGCHGLGRVRSLTFDMSSSDVMQALARTLPMCRGLRELGYVFRSTTAFGVVQGQVPAHSDVDIRLIILFSIRANGVPSVSRTRSCPIR